MQQVPLSEVEKDEWFCSAAFQASHHHASATLLQRPKTHEICAIYPNFFF